MKRVVAVMMVLSLMVAALAGCQKESDNSDVKVESGKLQEIHEAVKNAYGDNYIPSMPYDEVMLEDLFGIKQDMAKEIIAEGPMMSAQVDTFVGLEAADGIKLDKGLIDNIMTNNGVAILRAMVQVGHELGLTILAEGVEDSAQVEVLRQIHCDVIQGYQFYQPMPRQEARDKILAQFCASC